MNTCTHATKLISRRIDHEIEIHDDRALAGHLSACPACAALARAEEERAGELRRAVAVPTAELAALESRLAAALATSSSTPRRQPRGFPGALRLRVRHLAAGAAAALAVALGLWLAVDGPKPPEAPDLAAATSAAGQRDGSSSGEPLSPRLAPGEVILVVEDARDEPVTIPVTAELGIQRTTRTSHLLWFDRTGTTARATPGLTGKGPVAGGCRFRLEIEQVDLVPCRLDTGPGLWR